jgi:enamine deaminase RidA (YjgF/YER057c/UK114 family)
VKRRLIPSAQPREQLYGYSRAVVENGRIHVAGTAPTMPDDADPPRDAAGQARRCLEIIERALQEAGSSVDDVVRTRVYLTRAEDADAVGRVHGEFFALARPALTGVVVAALLDPRWLVEIEADAIVT